ncbi:MAG: capsular polysaccharide export protein, LipB/KpsS family, partial [Gaiellaceae bacterium]
HDLVEEVGLDPSRETYGLLTNVLWDAQLYYEGHGFAHMLEWLWTTIDHFAERPDRQLIIRIHPHEVKAGNRQPVGAEIARRYPKLPSNVFVVPHDSPLNTYALMALCRAVLIYGTKTGVELAPLGQPVVVAADAWIRDKGLTTDARTREEYARILDRLSGLEPLDHVTTDRARRYAYHYFFRRMIPLTSLVEGASDVTLAVESLDELLPGRDRGLDVVCNGILNGTAFTFDA